MPTQNLLRLVLLLNGDDEKHFDDSLLQIWKLNFVQTLSTRFGQKVEVQAKF